MIGHTNKQTEITTLYIEIYTDDSVVFYMYEYVYVV